MQEAWTDGRPGGAWRSRSARWPRSARLATTALVVLIGLTVVGAAVGDDRTEARTTGPATTTATTVRPRPFRSEVTAPPTTAAPTTTTAAPTTTTPTTVAPTTAAPAPTTTWAPPPSPSEAPAAPAGGYANCAAARAAGAAPVHIGEPGYAPRLDGDGDGVGCE